MAEQQPDPQRLRSIKLDLEKRYLQVESSDATILRLSLTPQGIAWELLQPPTITTARAVDKLADATDEADQAETSTLGKEKTPTQTFTGKVKGQVREGRPDSSGKKTAWARVAVHEEDQEQAKMLSVTFHRHTANLALALPAEAQITAQGYLRPSEDPTRMDSFYVFNLVNYPGKTSKSQDQRDNK
jgi:hypothetical protein